MNNTTTTDFRPMDVLQHYTKDIRRSIDGVYRDFMNGDNEILTWRGYESVTEALGISDSDMNKLISYWKKCRDDKNAYKKK